MKHLTQRKRLSLMLGPLVALVLVLNALGTISFSGFAYGTTASCPTDGTAVTGYSLLITRNGSTINATSFASVKQGDHVKVTFDLDDRCTSGTTPVSLVSYKSPSATYDANTVDQRVVYQSKTGNFGANGGTQEIDVPGCYFSTGLVSGSVITNMSSTNLYGSRKVNWQDGGTQSCSSSSSSTTTQTTSCPNDASAIASYYFTYGGSTTHRSDLSGAVQGDDVKAYFTLKSGCQGVTVSFAAYTAKEPYWNVNTATQQVYQPASNDTGSFGASGGYVHTVVPSCYFQIDFVWGNIIPQLDPNTTNGLYGDRKVAWLNGGTNACGSGPNGQDLPTPTPTKTPTKTATAVPPTSTPTKTPTKTATPITPTNPPATATNTPGNPGSTDVTPPMNTATTVPPTATNTPVPPATIKIHIRDSANNALDGATIQVQGPSGTSSVTDNGAGDGDTTAGEILLSNLSAGGYLGTQSAAKSGYFVDTHSESSSLQPGQTKEWTFVNLLPGNLNVLLYDGGNDALPGGCFQVNGPSGFSSAVCDGGSGDTDGASNGVVRFTGLLPGNYNGTQTTVPAGYVGDTSNPATDVPEGGDGVLTFINTLPPGSLVIKLYDTDGVLLGGGCFDVTGPSGYSTSVCDSEGTGVIRIEGLAQGDYSGTQTTPPAGYLRDESTQSDSVPSGGEGLIEFVDTQLGSLVITLTDPDGTPLAEGCYNVTGFSGPVCDDDGDGTVRLDNLIPGSYSGTQTSGPAGYDLDTHEATDDVPPGGEGLLEFVDTPQPGDLRIIKVDDDGAPLGDACFDVYLADWSYVTTVCDQDPDVDADDTIGQLVVANLDAGDYIVQESSSPNGYDQDENDWPVTVPPGGEGVVGPVVNHLSDVNSNDEQVIFQKINCQTAPGPFDPVQVFAGALPSGCVKAGAGVTFDIFDQNGDDVAIGVMTDANGRFTITIGAGVTSLTVVEASGTNPGFAPTGPFVISDPHCPCHHSEFVVTNVLVH